MTTRFISIAVLTAMLTAAASIPVRAEVPGEDEGLNAVIVAHDKEIATKVAAAAAQNPQGRAGVAVVNPMPDGQTMGHPGC